MGEDRRQTDRPACRVDRGRLHGRDLLLTEGLADELTLVAHELADRNRHEDNPVRRVVLDGETLPLDGGTSASLRSPMADYERWSHPSWRESLLP